MWDDLVAWFQSPGGARVLQTAIIPALAILVAGLLAALIARSAVRAVLRRAERAEATSAVAGLVAAARLAADAAGDPVAQRRAARLRSEADVRTRLLPLPGADLAADWASARTDALEQRAGDAPATAELNDLRDRLVEWVARPARAKRVFAAPAPAVSRASAPAPAPAATPTSAKAEPAAPQRVPAEPEPAPKATEPERPARQEAPSAPPEPEEQPAPAPEREPVVVAVAAPAASAAPAAADALPAWQRTRAVERLQQERSRGRASEPAKEAEDQAPPAAAPVQPARPHHVEAASTEDEDEAVRLEAHQQARHARPADQAQAPASAAPAWLDTYDDEAQVTQNLNLKTPPPVAASAVRDRGTGDDLVPRS